ncbi:MAG: TetR/AcrR family transcriptional regulator [Solirubrobacteraceae bacterium]
MQSADDAGGEHSDPPLIGPSPGARLRRGRRGRDGLTAEQAADSQRASLRAAMVAALGEHSYAELGVRELCERSGISSRDVYRHYRGGLLECYVDCAAQVTARIVREVARAWRRGDELHERIPLVIAAFTRLAAAEPGAARLALCEPFTVGPPAVHEMRMAEERLQEQLIAELSGCTPTPTVTAVRAMFAGVVDLTRARLLAGSHAELPGLAAELSAWALYCLQILRRAANSPVITVA